MSRRILSFLVVMVITVTAVFSGAASAFAKTDENLYLKQETRGTCTLVSATMLLRSKSVIEGNETWHNIVPDSVRKDAWIEGTGLRHSFTHYGMTVGYGDLKSSDKKAALLSLLKKHPEGVVIYVRDLPHAVLLTRYDKSGDTFYCADPGISATEMKLEDSWLRKVYRKPQPPKHDNENAAENSMDGEEQEKTEAPLPASVQQQILNAVDSYWYMASYKKMPIPEYREEGRKPGENTDPEQLPDPKPPKPEPPKPPQPEGPDSGQPKPEPPKPPQPPKPESVRFSKVRSYRDGLFSDVSMGDWFVPHVKASYEMNLMNGMTDNTFEPEGNMSIAQAITLAARIHSVYEGDKHDFEAADGEKWYAPYVAYAHEEGIITGKYVNLSDGDFEKDILRIQFAEIFAEALPDCAVSPVNTVHNGDIADVAEHDDNGKAVYKLYRAGILTGDTDGFRPYNPITRCQVAAIAARMADSSLRVIL